MARTLLAAALALMTVAPGCFVLRSGVDSVSTRWAMRRAAGDAWDRHEVAYEESPYEDEVEEGFKIGYRHFVNTGCATWPTRLPEKYALPKYQTCFGRNGIRAFYEGYRLGVEVASTDCAGLHGPKGPDDDTDGTRHRNGSQGGAHGNGPKACSSCATASGGSPWAAASNGGTSCPTCPGANHVQLAPAPAPWPIQAPACGAESGLQPGMEFEPPVTAPPSSPAPDSPLPPAPPAAALPPRDQPPAPMASILSINVPAAPPQPAPSSAPTAPQSSAPASILPVGPRFAESASPDAEASPVGPLPALQKPEGLREQEPGWRRTRNPEPYRPAPEAALPTTFQ